MPTPEQPQNGQASQSQGNGQPQSGSSPQPQGNGQQPASAPPAVPPPPPPSASAQSGGPSTQPQRPRRVYMGSKSPLGFACNLGNVLLALEQEPELANAFGYDQMLCISMLLRSLFTTNPTFQPREINEHDVSTVQQWLQWQGFRRLSWEVTLASGSCCHHAVINDASVVAA
jgi:hypothetical protein